MAPVSDGKLVEGVEAAIRRLVAVEHFRAGSIVSMPVLYPSGASVLLELSGRPSSVLVSDRGGGFHEADLMGAIRPFQREAERIAAGFGVRFDGRDIIAAEVPLDRLEGAMTLVAAASAQSASFAALKVAERQERNVREAMFEKLADAFGESGFERDIEFIGASNHKWRVDAMIPSGDRPVIFNSVTRSYVSAAGTAAKFFDLARLEAPPRRIAVVPSIAELGDWYGVVAGASDAVLELATANDKFRKVRNAA